MTVPIPAIGTISDPAQVRVALVRGQQLISAPLQAICSVGTYTPTITAVANISSTTALLCQYMRIGNQVMVWGNMALTLVAASDTITTVRWTLPIASAFDSTSDLVGVSTGKIGQVVADTTNNIATCSFRAEFVGAQGLGFTFSYLIA